MTIGKKGAILYGNDETRKEVAMAKISKDYFHNGEEKESVRINKYLSDSGMCSRREADRLIAEGNVLIDGEPAVMGSKVRKGQKVTIAGRNIKKENKMVLIAFHKPVGIVCTTDRREPDNIIDYIQYGSRIFPIGRLDKDSEGLILLTNDGEIVNKILRAGNYHEKEYIVKVNKPLTPAFLQGMASGVPILDTVTRPCTVEEIDRNTFRIVLTQGLNRQIRRMCEYFDYRVLSLKRVRIMNIRLGRLAVGGYRNLTDRELSELNEMLLDSSNAPVQEEETGKKAVVIRKEPESRNHPGRAKASEDREKKATVIRGKTESGNHPNRDKVSEDKRTTKKGASNGRKETENCRTDRVSQSRGKGIRAGGYRAHK